MNCFLIPHGRGSYRRHDGKYVTTCTHRYAHMNTATIRISRLHQLKSESFVGILLSGYHEVPRVSNYWSTQPDLGVHAAFNAMSRIRFHEIKR